MSPGPEVDRWEVEVMRKYVVELVALGAGDVSGHPRKMGPTAGKDGKKIRLREEDWEKGWLQRSVTLVVKKLWVWLGSH